MYYGEEIEMRGAGIDENKRLPMIWSESDKVGQTDMPIGANYDMDLQVQLGAYDQRDNASSLLNHYRKLIAVRNEYNDYIERATVTAVGVDTRIYGLEYTTSTGKLTILTNFGAEEVSEALSGTYELLDEIPTSQTYARLSVENGTTTIVVPPFNTVIIKEVVS